MTETLDKQKAAEWRELYKNSPEILKKQEVADWLRIPESTVMYLVATYQLPFVRVSPRKIRFLRSDIEEYIEQQKNQVVKYNKN